MPDFSVQLRRIEGAKGCRTEHAPSFVPCGKGGHAVKPESHTTCRRTQLASRRGAAPIRLRPLQSLACSRLRRADRLADELARARLALQLLEGALAGRLVRPP